MREGARHFDGQGQPRVSTASVRSRAAKSAAPQAQTPRRDSLGSCSSRTACSRMKRWSEARSWGWGRERPADAAGPRRKRSLSDSRILARAPLHSVHETLVSGVAAVRRLYRKTAFGPWATPSLLGGARPGISTERRAPDAILGARRNLAHRAPSPAPPAVPA